MEQQFELFWEAKYYKHLKCYQTSESLVVLRSPKAKLPHKLQKLIVMKTSILDFDGLAEAEKITGKSYKTDIYTQSLGMKMMLDNNKKKKDLLESQNDSTFLTTEEDYLRIVESIGFIYLLVEPFILCGMKNTQYC